ncbi:MAG: CIA30 family protein [Candidatus Competibacteraceae bacterium]|nr:CIA30 family protein [Candidatus Competibacteraceae bacterium]
MGGVSRETVALATIDGRRCVRLTGEVSLENNGGFIQMALDLNREGLLDASAYNGLRLLVRGNGEEYNVHLRTPDTVRPWQSYRASFSAPDEWQEVRLPFAEFQPYRLDTPLDVSRLRRLGLVAIGRPFQADLCVAEVSLY